MSTRLLSEYVHVFAGRARCRKCDHDLGPQDRNYKLGALVRDLPVTEGNPTLRDPALYADDTVVLREFVCPGCATLLETEISIAGAPPQWDIRVSP
jgi:acetone carboxylase gamma subunit